MKLSVKSIVAAACAVAVLVAIPAWAQERGGEKPAPVVTPLKVTVVLTRQPAGKPATAAEKLPFEMWVNTGSRATVRVSADAPVPTVVVQKDEASGKSTPINSYTYRTVGSNLTVDAAEAGDGRYRLELTIEDSQLMPLAAVPAAITQSGTQTYRATTGVLLRDGQTVQHSLGTNSVTGDTITISITAAVIK
jgi:hypothetical protein